MTRPEKRGAAIAPMEMSRSVTLRIAAALLGGYAFTWGFVSLGVAVTFAAGMAFHDAEHMSYLLGFLIYLVAFLWAFAARSLKRVWAVLAGGGAAMAVAASCVQYFKLV